MWKYITTIFLLDTPYYQLIVFVSSVTYSSDLLKHYIVIQNKNLCLNVQFTETVLCYHLMINLISSSINTFNTADTYTRPQSLL